MALWLYLLLLFLEVFSLALDKGKEVGVNEFLVWGWLNRAFQNFLHLMLDKLLETVRELLALGTTHKGDLGDIEVFNAYFSLGASCDDIALQETGLLKVLKL